MSIQSMLCDLSTTTKNRIVLISYALYALYLVTLSRYISTFAWSLPALVLLPVPGLLYLAKPSAFGIRRDSTGSVDEKTSNKNGTNLKDPDPLYHLNPETLRTFEDRPWRPFRWPYHQTMSLLKLDINHWLDMDRWAARYYAEAKTEIANRGKDVVDCLPDGEEGAAELLDFVVDHLTKRYPNLFKLTPDGVHNLITDEQISLRRPLKEHPLEIVQRLSKEDFYLAREREDGRMYMVGGSVVSPGGFMISQKMGQNIDEIHEPVPLYKPKLKPSMERWLKRLSPDAPVERASFFLTWDYGLFSSAVGYSIGETVPASTVPYEKFVVRVERQTLRKLPKSKVVIFSNHPIFYRICDMADEPGVPSILLKWVTEVHPDIAEYKEVHKYRDHLVPYLQSLVDAQLEKGLIEKDHEVKTAPHYPFAHWFDSSNEGLSPGTRTV